MKIAFILPSLINKGPVIAVNNLIKFLDSKVEVVDVYYFDEVKTPLPFKCSVRKIEKNEPIDFNNYDIIHSHTLRADLYLFKFRNKIFSSKIVSTIHQDTFTCFKIRYNIIVAFLLTSFWIRLHKSFDGVITISNDLERRYKRFLPKKITTIYNGCSIDNYQISDSLKTSILNIKERGFKVLCSYATITKGKGLSQIIEVLEQLDDFAYIIIGEGPYLNELKKLVDKLILNNRVFFFPYIPAPYSYLRFIDVYMMPSYSEGFGLAMVEAALEEKSIVCSSIPSFHELFSGEEVTFFNLNDSRSLIQAIKLAFIEKTSKGKRAHSKAKLVFTSEIMAEGHIEYYKSLLNK
ncbi:glycosyltransferase family 4 protein [Mucilaginibacter sp. RS28]|uniref:Glycosyltransferase family 4 protein n=1 Tax=Mucilaginibacter straminoryzae TaxID=2932774 RepID=A0A9X1X2Y3_9SPHI|nr:glycosyltransferase family 4 protein [Mucilaginibacter straminoryzae]MCJ8208573.1 glycosyltransferase family 4 protein [Mucilaginibacter straminoryzae]